jgi:HEPN domain
VKRRSRKSKVTEPDPFQALDLLQFADQFYFAFRKLPERPPPEGWPRYFLLCHSIELALKAYLAQHGASPEELQNVFRHDLKQLLKAAIKKRLPLAQDTQDKIKLLRKAHTKLRHRYPGKGPVYVIEPFIPVARELLVAVSNDVRGPGLMNYPK